MKYLCIQLQPGLNASVDKDAAISILTKEGFCLEVNQGDDHGPYIDILINSNNLEGDWQKVKKALIEKKPYAEASIVTCEGNDGWDDYLLLHHFNDETELDTF